MKYNNQSLDVVMNERIVSDPNICGGEPCIKGTRIPVHIILSHLAADDDFETILNNFPRITKEDIKKMKNKELLNQWVNGIVIYGYFEVFK